MWVSLKSDRKTADKTAKINSNGRASCMTVRPHTTSSAHQTVMLLAKNLYRLLSLWTLTCELRLLDTAILSSARGSTLRDFVSCWNYC